MNTNSIVPTRALTLILTACGLACAATGQVFPAASTVAVGVTAEITEEEAYQIGVEAYIYFYPLISMDVTRRLTTNLPAGAREGLGPANAFHHFRTFPDANFREVVRPNFDTLYSSAWLDLTGEPMVVSSPDMGDRYFLLPMLDMWSNVFAVPGTRTSGNAKANWVVVGPGWKGEVPQGLTRINAPTPHVWIIGRTVCNGPSDYAAVATLQDQYLVTPLSQWGKTRGEPTFVADTTVDMKTPPVRQVNTMPAERYFSYGAELMAVNPAQATDWSTLARLARIGIRPGEAFDFTKAPPQVQRALTRAVKDGLANMVAKTPTLARVVNGWQMNTETMGVYGNHYMKRAIVALVGLGANQTEDAIYPLCVVDADGKPMMGEHNYVIEFGKDERPPADAFWSVTMYDAEGFQVANPINRFAIGDRDGLTYNADGSLTLYIQHASPGADKESNWLPSPAQGTLGVTMRLYMPRTSALDGRWNPPAVKRVK